jgi:tetratricopeptide (TPR) repeat protein
MVRHSEYCPSRCKSVRRFFTSFIVILLTTVGAYAQRSLPGGNNPDTLIVDIPLRIRVVNQTTNAKVEERVRVRLLDESGAEREERYTSSESEAVFLAPAGNFRVKIDGRTIQSFTSDVFTIQLHETAHVETMFVKGAKIASGEATASNPTISLGAMNVPAGARHELDRGEEAALAGKVEEARKHLDKAVKLYPKFAAALNDLGVLEMRDGNREQGRDYFRQAVAADDHFPDALVNLARLEFADRNFSQAERLLAKAVALGAANAEILTILATSQLADSKAADAIATAQKVYLLPHERFALAHFIAARGYQATNRPFDAEREYEAFLKENPAGNNAELARASLAELRSHTPQPHH